jgi:hypothetical protein
MLAYAQRALEKIGVCAADLWPYDGTLVLGNVTHHDHPASPRPEPEAVANALTFATAGLLAPFKSVGSGRAKVLRELLGNHRAPVAITVPVFAASTGFTNWETPEAEAFGAVADPLDFLICKGGHAVCVTGFVQVPSEPCGGFFTFRNSWGGWAASASFNPDAFRFASAPGYGSISASYIDNHMWEACVLPPHTP